MSYEPTEWSVDEDGLAVYTFYLECLAQGSYIVAHDGVAFLVDPRRDIDIYTKFLEKKNLKLKGVLESHLHADFVSGHLELHKKFGTTIFIGENAGAKFPHYPVADGESLVLSPKYSLKALATPGHTFGCVTWLVVNNDTDAAVKAFTGDTLFVGGNGRPDLVGAILPDATPEKLSEHMFQSLKKLAALPDACAVLPAHGPGSPCGKGISNDLASTIKQEKETNPAFKYTSLDEFIAYNTEGLDTAPQYFPNAVLANMEGADDIQKVVNAIPLLTTEQALDAIKEGAVILDTRDANVFAQKHIKGALNVPLGGGGGVKIVNLEDGNFAIWVGTMIPAKKDIILVASPGKKVEAMERIGRIGYAEQIKGIVDCDCERWKREQNDFIDSYDKITVKDAAHISDLKEKEGFTFIDTRTAGEFACPVRGHVHDAINMPLNHIAELAADLDKSKKYIVYCLGGFRSTIAVSVLRSMGVDATDVVQGLDGGILPVAREATTSQA